MGILPAESGRPSTRPSTLQPRAHGAKHRSSFLHLRTPAASRDRLPYERADPFSSASADAGPVWRRCVPQIGLPELRWPTPHCESLRAPFVISAPWELILSNCPAERGSSASCFNSQENAGFIVIALRFGFEFAD